MKLPSAGDFIHFNKYIDENMAWSPEVGDKTFVILNVLPNDWMIIMTDTGSWEIPATPIRGTVISQNKPTDK